eukprot:CAMPEP_0118856642 /NCGR_PEP_ID=MMETSP1163-20130328/4006_1 /TAXON_ID=124430 /ORGANISM="Phaeomonas parva, Strain CCMP2877" /LENGTH=197 /DNA_ID=CAMNT_0006789773 /DNA_START=225 /DNA_END=818 /DNA_ORIENTATION=+
MAATIAPAAYVKIALHAAKYANSRVDGLLIGRVVDGEIKVDDVLPLFHISTSAVMLEAACALAEQLFPGSDSGSDANGIVGYYFANERDSDGTTPAIAENIVNKLSEVCGFECLLVQLFNKGLAGEKGQLCVRGFGRDQKKGWKRQIEVDAAPSAAAADALLDHLILTQAELRLVDFDDHCEDAAQDWQNAWVAAEL